jgi:hypothetical protein
MNELAPVWWTVDGLALGPVARDHLVLLFDLILLFGPRRSHSSVPARTVGTPVSTCSPFWTVVTIRLTIASLLEFAKFTGANVGAKTELRVDGKVVNTFVIKEAIRGTLSNPTFQISGNLSIEDAVELAKRLSSANARIEVEIVPS